MFPLIKCLKSNLIFFPNFCRPLIKNIAVEEFYEVLVDQSQNSSAKMSLITEEQSLNLLQYLDGKSLKWHQLKNVNFYVSQIGFFFLPNNFFLHIIDKETQRLTSAGIMNHLLNLIFKDKCSFTFRKEWKVLAMENLQFGFVIWLCSCAVTAVVFVAEVMFWIIMIKVKRGLIGYIRYEWKKFPVNYPVKIRMSHELSIHN